MLALKKGSVMCNFIHRLSNIRPIVYSRKLGTTVDNQAVIKNDVMSSHSQTSLQNHVELPLSSYMEPELKKKGALYENIYQDVIRELTDFSKFTLKPNEFNEAKDHFIKMLDYNLSDGQRYFFNITTKMYFDLMANKEITTENIKQANLLGWCMELLLSAYLINDDIADNAELRRGKLCWPKVKGMERIAMNDMLMLEGGCNLILNRYFGHLQCYNGMIKTVTETFMTSLMGHSLEMHFNGIGLERFTLENYNYSAVMKGAYYTFYMPSSLTLLLAGYDLNTDKWVFDNIKRITHEVGPFFQAQNDFLDCFVDQNGKPEQDIQSGKCSWFATMAMQLGSEMQKDVMRQNYGKCAYSIPFQDADCVAKVKQVYSDLQLREMYFDYKKRNYYEVMEQTKQLMQSDETLCNACLNFFDSAYD